MDPWIRDQILKVKEETNSSFQCATDVYFFRGKIHWTLAKERELIRLHKEGNPPDMSTFGITAKSQTRLKRIIADIEKERKKSG